MIVDKHTEEVLLQLNKDFYDTYAASFSRTRDAAWEGWEQLLYPLSEQAPFDNLRVLDVGAGNLRFAAFLHAHVLGKLARRITYVAVDGCRELLDRGALGLREAFTDADAAAFSVRTLEGDVRALSEVVADESAFDLVVAFGLMHHLPRVDTRVELMEQMRGLLSERGLIVVSFWRFLDEEARAEKARKQTAEALTLNASARTLGAEKLASSDCLLGWQGASDVPRYCHSFTDEDISVCTLGVEVCCVNSWEGDGKSHRLNAYRAYRHATHNR